MPHSAKLETSRLPHLLNPRSVALVGASGPQVQKDIADLALVVAA